MLKLLTGTDHNTSTCATKLHWSIILDTDASDFAIGAELIQVQDDKERVIAYESYNLTPEQLRYCTTRKESLSIIRFTKQFQHYLLGREFTIRTYHSSLVRDFQSVQHGCDSYTG
jgi:hypothetical protein